MKVWARINRVGWVHLWRRREDFDGAQPSAHFVNGRTDPRWLELRLSQDQRRELEAGGLVELDDPGYFADEDPA